MADVWNQTQQGLKASREASSAEQEPAFYEDALNDAAVQQLEISKRKGEDGTQAASELMDRLGVDPEGTAERFIQSQTVPSFKRTELNRAIAQERENQLRSAKEWADRVSFTDAFSAAWQQNTATGAIIEGVKRESFKPDPSFDYLQHREELEAGLSDAQIDWLRQDSMSLEHAQSLRQQALEENEANKEIFANGTLKGITAMLSAGLMDPVGWFAGAGVGKGLQLAGVGSRALAAQGRTAAALGSLTAESAAGNVAVEAIIDASGQNVDAADYAAAGAFGAIFGIGMSPFVLRGARGVNAEGTQAQIKQMQETYRAQLNDVYERARTEAGPGATSDEIAREARRIQADEFTWFDRARTAPVDASEQILRRPEGMTAEEFQTAMEGSARLDEEPAVGSIADDPMDGTTIDPEAQQAAPTAPPRPRIDDFTDLNTPTLRNKAKKDYGTDLLATEDPGKARFINEMIFRAERFVAENPIDEGRMNDLIGRFESISPTLSTTAQNLMRSKHPMARMYAQIVLENATGAGGRRTTAAIDKYMSETIYHKHVEGFETVYNNWRRAQGGRFYSDIINRDLPNRFDRELTAYMSQRWRGEDPAVDPNIRAAANMLEAGYRRAANDQIKVGTPGAENIPSSSAGYFPRRLNPAKVTAMSNEQQRALAREFDRQLEDSLDDPKLRAKVANRIVDRMRAEAQGGYAPSPQVRSNATAVLVRNALKDSGLKEADINNVLSKINTGGPAYTKSRLDLDLTAKITDPESGQTFQLSDLYETNQLKLFLNYTRRASGEVALAKRGIMGKNGLDLIRESLVYGRNNQKLHGKELDNTLRAFDQTASELLGSPYGQMTNMGRNEWINNLRMLTAASRLGGMAFTQFAEFANAVPALGIAAAFRGVRLMPTMLRQLRTGEESPILGSIEKVGGEFGGEYKQIFPYADTDDIYIVSGEELSVFSRGVRAASRKMQFYNMWHYVAAAQTRGMSQQIVSKALKAVRDGKDDIMLDDMGIDADLRAGLRKNLDRIAQFDERGDLTSVDVSGLDPQLTHRFATAVNRGAKQIIQGSFIGETGYWAHSDLLKLLTQFRTFSLTSMEKQWVRMRGTKGTVKAAGYLLGMMSFALPIHLARVHVAALGREDGEEYIERQTSLPALTRSLLNYSSLSGLTSDALDVGYGGLGVVDNTFGTNLAPESANVRGTGGGDLGNIVPGLDYANDVFGFMKDPTDLGKAAKLAPGGNLPYLVPLLNGLEADDEETDDRI